MSSVKVTCEKPLCPGELSKTFKNEVEIDYCPHCKGVWLDKGELDKIIQSEEKELDQVEDYHLQNQRRFAQEQQYQRPVYEPYYKHHKKKPIWKELFDFD